MAVTGFPVAAASSRAISSLVSRSNANRIARSPMRTYSVSRSKNMRGLGIDVYFALRIANPAYRKLRANADFLTLDLIDARLTHVRMSPSIL